MIGGRGQRRPSRLPGRLRCAALVTAGLLAGDAGAREVAVPVRFDHALVVELLRGQVFTGAGGTLSAVRDEAGCNGLVLSEPEVDTEAGRLRVTSRAEARVGTALGADCLVVLRWSGYVQTLHAPSVAPGTARVLFPVVDSRVLDAARAPGVVTGNVWEWIKGYAHPRLGALVLDLGPALADLRGVLGAALAPGAPARALLDSLDLYEVESTPDALEVTIVAQVPDAPLASIPEPALSVPEIAGFETAWQDFDAFLTFVVKRSARDAGDAAALGGALRDVLLAGRHDLSTVLGAGETEPDTVRRLFARSWARLAPVLRRADTGMPAAAALRYLGFVAAGDALAALDALGPGTGLDLSTDGLRRFARIIAPGERADPLARDPGVDPELRALLGFGPPIPVPPPPPSPGARWLPLRAAWASGSADAALAGRLNRLVADVSNLSEYLPLARDLLDRVARLTERAAPARELFRPLLLATAWQESCWRQFVRRGESVRPIASAAGSVGMMQVNLHVWRGFYDGAALASDIGYNARAGAEILAHYLADHVMKGHARGRAIPDVLARSAYAAYNGGPGQLRRFRTGDVGTTLQALDETFHAKYRAVRAGDDLAVRACYGP